MGNPYPVSTCTVGPFDSYNSNVVNRLTRMVSRNIDCNLSADKVDVSITSGTQLTLTAGSVIKDDVLIQIEDITIDFGDIDYYYYGLTWNAVGYYYVLLYYVYEKARPAPKPKIQILRPDQKSSYIPDGSGFVLLKVAKVELVVSVLTITELFDYDPDVPTNIRIFSSPYLGLEPFLPTFDYDRDNGRLVKNLTDDSLYYGGESSWLQIPSITWVEGEISDIETEVSNLRTYVGASGPTDTDPNYSSIQHIVQSSDLTTAISTLDLSLGFSDLKKTISDNSATPSILSAGGKICGFLYVSNTVPTTITNLTGAPSVSDNECVIIILKFANSNTTIQNNSNINLIDAANLSGAASDTLVLVRHLGVWNELFRNIVLESTLFHVDHDSSGHHKLGGWHIGTDEVPSTVTATNLSTLTDGVSNAESLHTHGSLIFLNTPTRLVNVTGPFDWTDIDITSNVPAGAKKAYVQMEVMLKAAALTTDTICRYWLRQKGSTQTLYLPHLFAHTKQYVGGDFFNGMASGAFFVPLDVNYKFQVKWQLVTGPTPDTDSYFTVDLLGYSMT